MSIGRRNRIPLFFSVLLLILCNVYPIYPNSTIDISGTWEGIAQNLDYNTSASFVIAVTQSGNIVTGKWASPGAYPQDCGYWRGDITGTLQGNIFTFTGTDAVKDLVTCQILCIGTVNATAKIEVLPNEIKMTGEGTDEFCIDGELMHIVFILKRTDKKCFTFSGYHDEGTKNLNLFQVETNMIDINPLVGGLVMFDASEVCDPEGPCGCKYFWDFDGGELIKYDGTSAKPVVEFKTARKYNITLNTTSSCNEQDTMCQQTIDLSLELGDLIFIRTPGWTGAFDLVNEHYTHVGMYVGNINGIEQMIEASLYPDHKSELNGVHLSPLSGWAYPTEKFATAYRVKNITPNQRQQAVEFALARRGWPYDKYVSLKQLYGNSYYCSELIWAAYYDAAGIDLGQTGPLSILPVHPDSVAIDTNQLTLVGGHWEHYAPKLRKGNASVSAIINLLLGEPSPKQ